MTFTFHSDPGQPIKDYDLQNFIQFIKLTDRIHAFRFAQVKMTNGNKFFITATDTGGNSVSFEMRPTPFGNWLIIPPAPGWIMEIEKQLSDIIKQKINKAAK